MRSDKKVAPRVHRDLAAVGARGVAAQVPPLSTDPRMDSWQPAYIGVGSNLEDPRAQVLAAITRLAQLPRTRLVLASKLYRSRPFGPVAQPDFVNAVAGILTQLEPKALMGELHAIESAMGRPERHAHWGPRIIDLDLLAQGHERREEPHLTLPHPGIVDRNFVLYPLAEIAPDLVLPGLGRVADLAAAVTAEGITRL
jgi:2-amino-4-hydroxy-6-hydroxymethyldihydropteridine diphosphokinase